MHNADLKFFYSKSTAIADGEAGHDNRGGRISADYPVFLFARPTGTGIAVSDPSSENKAGVGTLTFTLVGSTLSWKAPKDTVAGTAVAVGIGTYTLESADSNAWITVVITALPTANAVISVVLEQNKNLFFNDVNLDDAMYGLTDYSCVFVKNVGLNPMINVVPVFKYLWSTTIALTNYYAANGTINIRVTDASRFPASGFLRNIRTWEIMFYTLKTGSDGNEFVIAGHHRGLRDTSSAQGLQGDSIELVAPVDIAVIPYVPLTGAPKIPDAKIPPLGISFYYPTPAIQPNYFAAFSLAANDILAVWFRRTIPEGASEIAGTSIDLGFSYEI